jgi:hypothetical protein
MNFGGKQKMRKESIGRLLMTLLTAFVMVAGVFSAAVLTNTQVELSTSDVAARELDKPVS